MKRRNTFFTLVYWFSPKIQENWWLMSTNMIEGSSVEEEEHYIHYIRQHGLWPMKVSNAKKECQSRHLICIRASLDSNLPIWLELAKSNFNFVVVTKYFKFILMWWYNPWKGRSIVEGSYIGWKSLLYATTLLYTCAYLR